MEIGDRRVDCGEWRVESGEWRVGEWRVVSGATRGECRGVESAEWRLESGVWWSVVECGGVVSGEGSVQSQWTVYSGQCTQSQWTVDSVQWSVGSGVWRLESGEWRVKSVVAQEKKRQEQKPPNWGSHHGFHLVWYLHRLTKLSSFVSITH